MSKYTSEVRFICEHYAGLSESAGGNTVEQIITTALPKVFDFDFPIFDESYRSVLETKILRHFYTREICEETVGLWKLRLNTRLNDIMPYYNQRYASELITFNPLFDTDLTTNRDDTFGSVRKDTNDHYTVNGGNDIYNQDGSIKNEHRGNDKNEYDDRTSVNTELHFESDTPQSTIAAVNDNNYATSFTKDVTTPDLHNDSKTTYNSDSEDIYDKTDTTTYGKTTRLDMNDKRDFNSTDKWIEKMVGKRNMKSYSQMLNEFRTTFLNIDMEIINELNDLFFNLW